MAGEIYAKERSILTLSSSQGSLANLTAVALGTDLDCRTGGNAAEDFLGIFELVCQWATITSIVLNTVVADLYLVPKLDGTHLPDVDATTGTSAMPQSTWAANFVAVKAPVANTDMRFISQQVSFNPLLYTPYLLNRSGQTMSASWTLKTVSVRGQYS